MAQRIGRLIEAADVQETRAASYLLVVADNVGSNSVSTFVNIVGQLPSEIKDRLRGGDHGRFSQVRLNSSLLNYI